MDTMQAFLMAEKNRGKEEMVFDWDKAAMLIKKNKPSSADAGLRGDWEYTGGEIYEDGKPVYEYTFLASTWAVPELDIDGVVYECYKMASETDGWNHATKWPKSALKILED